MRCLISHRWQSVCRQRFHTHTRSARRSQHDGLGNAFSLCDRDGQASPTVVNVSGDRKRQAEITILHIEPGTTTPFGEPVLCAAVLHPRKIQELAGGANSLASPHRRCRAGSHGTHAVQRTVAVNAGSLTSEVTALEVASLKTA